MSCCDDCAKDTCCALILKSYSELNQTIQECRPDIGMELLESLFYLLGLANTPIYNRLKCGRVFCCEGLVNAILCAFKTYLNQGDCNINQLIVTLNCILGQYSFSITCDPSALPPPSTFAFTGIANQPLVVPPKVFRIKFDLYGAQGGSTSGVGGTGGRATATLAVCPGDLFYLNIGGRGGNPSGPVAGSGGFNGGGRGGSPGSGGNLPGAGGGGATDIRQGGTALSNRIMIAGGGGGASGSPPFGGDGGGLTGTNGGGLFPGLGGTQLNGGSGGGGTYPGANGILGLGGNGGTVGTPAIGIGGGGGGGGLYGGGGGGGILLNSGNAGSGGGGSGFGPAGTAFQTGGRFGNGQIIVTYECF